MRRARRRGQAVVELSLGLIVIVTILLFGIHFAELGYLGAKVHEAAASTLWDSTAYRSYQFDVWYDSSALAVPQAQTNGARYSDFDGRASVAAHGAPTMVLTQAQPMQVTCQKPPGVQYALPPLAPPFAEAGGASCAAQADVSPVGIGTNFLNDGQGFFREVQKKRPLTTLCATGRLTAGACGSLSLLLGDDALTTQSEAQECQLTHDSPVPCGNTHFYDMTLRSWDRSMQLTAGWAGGYTGAPEAWARGVAPGLPSGRITGFYLSFRGEESNPTFAEPVPNGGSWETNPINAMMWSGPFPYATAYGLRQGCAGPGGYCWLGRYACN